MTLNDVFANRKNVQMSGNGFKHYKANIILFILAYSIVQINVNMVIKFSFVRIIHTEWTTSTDMSRT